MSLSERHIIGEYSIYDVCDAIYGVSSQCFLCHPSDLHNADDSLTSQKLQLQLIKNLFTTCVGVFIFQLTCNVCRGLRMLGKGVATKLIVENEKAK